MKIEKRFKFLEHTADIKFQAFGKSLEEVFKNSALATAKAICAENVKGKFSKEIKVKGKDKENLLYNFLEEIIFLFDAENFLTADVRKIKIEEGKEFKLNAEIVGDNSQNYKAKENVKAITYSEMFVKKDAAGWKTQVVLDV